MTEFVTRHLWPFVRPVPNIPADCYRAFQVRANTQLVGGGLLSRWYDGQPVLGQLRWVLGHVCFQLEQEVEKVTLPQVFEEW